MMTPLVARDTEIATIRTAVSSGRPRTVVITGPAGVGKSRLVHEAVGSTPAVQAMASPVAATPFGLVNDLVSADPAGDHATTVRVYVAALQRLPQQVVIVEDLHWADADSLAVLVDLARAPHGPVLLATTRDEPHRALIDALGALASAPQTRMLTLTGVSTGAVATMVESIWRQPVPVRVAMQLRRRTDGLPYWVEELARAAPTPDELAHTALPALTGAALRARVQTAGPAAVQLAEAAAVLGEQVDLDLLGRVLDQPVATLLPQLRRLVSEWVMQEVQPAKFAFRHSLTREAVSVAVPEPTRRGWHQRAYHVLRERDADDALLARHALAGGLSTAATHAQRAATTLLAAGSAAEALRMVEVAFEAGAAPTWQLHKLAAQAAYGAGWLDEAEAHAQEWWQLSADTAAESAVDARCLLASLRWSAGDLAGQQRQLREAVTMLDNAAVPDDSPARGKVYAALASALLRAEQDEAAIIEADRAVTAAERANDPTTWRDALTSKATATCRRAAIVGDPAGQRAGLALLAEAEQACEQAEDHLALGRVLNNGLEYRMAGRPDAEQWAAWEMTWRRANRLGLHPFLGKIVRQGIDLAYRTGQWQRGWQAATTRLPEESDPVERVVLAAKAALLALEVGRVDEAVRLTERSTAEAAGMDQFWAVLYVALADVAVTAHTAPVAHTIRALTRYRNAVTPADHARRAHRAGETALWALDAGVPPTAVRGFLTATLAGHTVPWLDLALAERVGDDDAAVTAGETLLAEPSPWPAVAVWRADILTRMGRSLLRLGRTSQAKEYAEEACALLSSWPGRRLAAAQALRDAAAPETQPALTHRERHVLALLAEGLSNREIGDRLTISARTVAVHVSRLLRKTGCASRTELAVIHLRAGSPLR